MKKFIQHKLRIILEGRLGTHTPSNPVGQDPKLAKQDDLSRTTNKIVSLNKKYGKDSYFHNTHEGDGIYMATIHTNGHVTIKTPNTKRKLGDSDIGLMWTGTKGNKHVFIKAHRGMEHPDIDEPRTGTIKGKSPADDAAIKTHLIFANDILEFVKQNMEGESDYTTDTDDKDFSQKTPEKQQYKYDKLEKEKVRQQARPEITTDPDQADEFERKQAELKAKIDKIRQRRGQ